MRRAFSLLSSRHINRRLLFSQFAIKRVSFPGVCWSSTMATYNSANGATDSRPVFFFDIDNCVCDSLAASYVFQVIGLANDHTDRSFIRKVRGHRPPRIDQSDTNKRRMQYS